ncbi:deaminase domain-containing protein [Stenotrophomonas sp. AB1(2024)]|uniref:deaminase domain-containing protein n=1 Tax=Stenotrophomonas sp. AB1(2024) TaxID=3132215 RepID=UPI0030B0AB42
MSRCPALQTTSGTLSRAQLAPPPRAHRLPGPDRVQNRPQAASPTSLSLIGVPRAQLGALGDALAKAPIDTTLLHALLDGGLPGTPLGQVMADWLAANCILPACSEAEAATWRCVLLHALRLPAAQWQVECITERAQLSAVIADAEPLLQQLRDALYRPADVAPAAWQAMLATHRGHHAHTDARHLALAHQRAQYAGLTTDARHATVHAQLQQLAPDASQRALQQALRCVRQHEQRDAGLLDPRAGLPAVFDSLEPSSIAAIHARLAALHGGAPDDRRATPERAPFPILAAQLLAVAHQANVEVPVPIRPLGRYDSATRALVSVLSAPWQLPQMVGAGFDLVYAGAVGARLLGHTALPAPETVADIAQPHALDAAWMGPLTTVACTPAAGAAAPVQGSDALLGRQRPGTALAQPGQCWEERRTVPGLLRAQAAAIGALLARQGDPAATSQRPSMPVAAAGTEGAMADGLRVSRRGHHPDVAPQALAGALTDMGVPVFAPPATAPLIGGAVAQAMVPVQGALPLAVLVPLMDRIPPRDWWNALDWQVPRTPAGLHAAVTDAFAQAGLDLQQRTPTPATLAAFFDAAPARAWYAALQEFALLPEGAKRTLADGNSYAARAYAFTRMLDVLTHGTHADADAAALHGLARIGSAAVEYLQGQTDVPLAGAHAHFDALAWQTDTVAGRLPVPMTDPQLDAHRARMRQAYGWPVPHADDPTQTRRWLVETAPALLDATGFEVLDAADALLADLLVTLRGTVDPLRFGEGWEWRGSAPTAADWRDHLERRAAMAGTHWATELGALFHHIAASLARYDDLEPALQSVIDPRRSDLRVLTRDLIAPVVQLYAGLDMPMDRADPWYGVAYSTCAAFFAWVGETRSSPALDLLERMDLGSNPMPLRRLLPPVSIAQPLPGAVIRHLLGSERYPATAPEQERALLRLMRGDDSRQLIAATVGIASEAVAPELAHGFFRTLAALPGGDALGAWRAAFERGSTWHLSPAEWLTLQPASAVAALWRAPDAYDSRQGLVDVVNRASASLVDTRQTQGVPALWTRILEGPSALDAWCASDDARHTAWRHLLRPLPGGSAPSRLDHAAPLTAATCAALLAASAQAQLALPGELAGWSDRSLADDGAPVLSLAIALQARYPALTTDEAIAFSTALLPPMARAATGQRAPLQFPLLAPRRDTPAPRSADDAALPEYALRATPTMESDAAGPDPARLPALDALLDRIGLSLLHPRSERDSDAAPLAAADAWDLMSRTRQFADFCRPLLAEAGWYGGSGGEAASARGTQSLLARLMLERYVGREQIAALRDRFASPAVVDVPFTVLASELRDAVLQTNLDASPAALEMVYWMLASELDQPALLVSGIPEYLSYGRSPLSMALRHATTFLDAMQPGACGRVDFDTVTALPAQLALPAHAPGEHDELHDAWARTLVPAAVAYASAHGAISNTTRLDEVSAQQISDALAFVHSQQGQHALHVEQLGSPPPRRMDVAAQTLHEAGLEPSLWSKRPADIGEDYLARHGIVPSRLIAFESGALALGKPSAVGGDPADDDRAQALVTNDDSLQALLVADAYVSTSGPTTADRYATEFDAYQRRVEAGLAGLIATALDGLPADDRRLLQEGTCTTLRVSCDGRQADQGLLVSCDPPGSDDATVYFEVVPQAGMARRAWQDPVLGPLIDFEGLISGAVRRTRDGNDLNPLPGLTLASSGVAIRGSDAQKLPGIAKMAATHLWQPVLERVRDEELAHLTGLEQLWQRERHMLNQLAEFAVPGYTCAEHLRDGDFSAGSLVGCAMDATIVLPVGTFVRDTALILRTAGERSVRSIAAEAGSAVLKLGTDLVRQGGIGTLETVGKGALWVGSHAWNSALQGAGWLRRALRTGTALDGSAQALERAVAHGAAPAGALRGLQAATPSLAEARLEDGRAVLIVAQGTAWHRFDLFTGRAYGPPLEGFTFEHDLPSTIPARRTEQGLQVSVGDTPVQFLAHGDDAWDVLLHGQRYRLNADGNALEAQPDPGWPAEPGHWQPVPASCRPRRSLVVLPCAQQSRLRFVPDAASDLDTDALPPERLDAIAAATRDFTLDLGHVSPDNGETLRLLVHKGEICAWSPSPNGAPPQLPPLPAAQRDALGLPASVTYPDTLRGTLVDAPDFGLGTSAQEAHLARLRHTLPVVDIGALAPGIEDARRLRAIRVESPFLRALCIEPDDGVFYQTALPSADAPIGELHFTRLQPGRDTAAITAYLRAAEKYRVTLLRPYLEQDRENIARLAFGYIQPGLGQDLAQRFPTYEAYVDAFAARGRPDVLTGYADKVLTGQREQRTFVGLARKRIPDWQALGQSGMDERAAVADILNALLPATGGKGSWSGTSAAALAEPDAGRPILDHLKGANLAFVEVIDDSGQRTIYYALSGGKRARNVRLRPDPTLGDGTRFVDARMAMQGVAPLPTITSLPVVLGSDGTRVAESGRYLHPADHLRYLDSERLIASSMGQHNGVSCFRLFSLLDTCDSCGGVVLPQLRARFPDAAPFSVRYLQNYGADASAVEPPPPVAADMQPDPGLVTYFDQWRRDGGMR